MPFYPTDNPIRQSKDWLFHWQAMNNIPIVDDGALLFHNQRDTKAAVATRRRMQRAAQKVTNPVKYERTKSNNKLSTDRYNKLQKKKVMLMTGEELLEHRTRKAEARKHQRLQKRIAFFGMHKENRMIVDTSEVAALSSLST